jgi:hypothetical protein
MLVNNTWVIKDFGEVTVNSLHRMIAHDRINSTPEVPEYPQIPARCWHSIGGHHC